MPLSQVAIEQEIVRLCGRLEEETDRYAALSDDAAEAEVAYRLVTSQAMVRLVAANPKWTVAMREARVLDISREEFRQWKLLDRRLDATKQALTTLRARLDAMRTLAANVRHQT